MISVIIHSSNIGAVPWVAIVSQSSIQSGMLCIVTISPSRAHHNAVYMLHPPDTNAQIGAQGGIWMYG